MNDSTILLLQSDNGVQLLDGDVQQWNDQSGCGNNAFATTALTRPEIMAGSNHVQNGKQLIHVDDNHFLKVPLTSSNEYSFFFAARTSNPQVNIGTLLGSNNISGFRWALGVGTNAQNGFGWGGQGNINFGANGVMPADSFKLISFIKTPTLWSIYCNGVFVRSIADSTFPNYSGDGIWCIGREIEAASGYSFTGDIGEVRILEEALKNGQRKKLEKEIMGYWGL